MVEKKEEFSRWPSLFDPLYDEGTRYPSQVSKHELLRSTVLFLTSCELESCVSSLFRLVFIRQLKPRRNVPLLELADSRCTCVRNIEG